MDRPDRPPPAMTHRSPLRISARSWAPQARSARTPARRAAAPPHCLGPTAKSRFCRENRTANAGALFVGSTLAHDRLLPPACLCAGEKRGSRRFLSVLCGGVKSVNSSHSVRDQRQLSPVPITHRGEPRDVPKPDRPVRPARGQQVPLRREVQPPGRARVGVRVRQHLGLSSVGQSIRATPKDRQQRHWAGVHATKNDRDVHVRIRTEARSHKWTCPSSAAAASTVPSGLKHSERGVALGPRRMRMHSPEDTSQTRTVLSVEPAKAGRARARGVCGSGQARSEQTKRIEASSVGGASFRYFRGLRAPVATYAPLLCHVMQSTSASCPV